MSQGTFEYVHALMFTYDWGIDLSQFCFAELVSLLTYDFWLFRVKVLN